LWKFWNEVIHGSTIEEQAQQMLTVLHDQATAHYEEYTINPDIVLGRHQSLFTMRTLAERLHSPYDALAAWIRSVDEAILVQDQRDAALREASQLFFSSQSTHPDLPTDSSYTEHSSTDEETSLDTTHTYIHQIEDGTSSITSDFDDTTCSTNDTDTSTSGVASPVTFGTASLVQPVLNVDILSSAYIEQTTTLTSNDPELNYDYIDHGTECSQLTQASSQQHVSNENRSCLTAASFSSESNPIVPTSISWNPS
jgi:hypothetical protein